MRTVTKPIFIVGTGRSGSTTLHALLSCHPEVAWLSRLCERFPGQPSYNRRLMEAIDLPLIGRQIRSHLRPSEAYSFWREYARGFSRPFRDLSATDVTNREKKAVREAMAQLVTQTRRRLLVKITGWPRVGYLAEIFPDARFIHLVRDGRAVANSMLATSFWDGWHGPERWRWDTLTDEQQKMWDATDRSFVALAGLEWIIMQSATEKACGSLPPSQFLEVRYEDLCASTVQTVQKIAQFTELDWCPQFQRIVENYSVRSTNFKWQTDLTSTQIRILEDIERPYLERYGYLPDSNPNSVVCRN